MRYILRVLFLICAAFSGFAGAVAQSACLTCPSTTPSPGQLTFSGQAATAGDGSAVYGGTDGQSAANRFGNSTVDITFGSSGGLCTTPDCASGTGGITAGIAETVTTSAQGVSNLAGTTAQAAQNSSLAGLVSAGFPSGFGIQLGVTTAAAGAAGAGFAGDSGSASAAVTGESVFTGGLTATGTCPTCTSGNWELGASINQTTQSAAQAMSITPNVPSVASGSTGLNATTTISIGGSPAAAGNSPALLAF